MAANAYFPEDWAAMLQFLVDWARDNTPALVTAIHAKAVRAGSGVPAPPKPYAWIHVIVPPIDEGRGDDNARLYPGACLTVEAPAPGTYDVTIGSSSTSYIAGAGETEEQIVDGLIAAISALGEPVVVTKQAINVGPYAHVVAIRGSDPATPGTLPTITFSSNMLLKRVRATENEAVATIGVDIIGRNEPEAETQAGPIAESVTFVYALQGSLQDTEVQQAFCEAGWAIVSVEGMRKPDLIFNGAWEDRSGFDLRLRCRTRILRVGDYIETVAPGAFVGSFTT